MKDLSIFVDESGDFGLSRARSPFYIFTLVFHRQSSPIADAIIRLQQALRDVGLLENHCFHAGPIIRREDDYKELTIIERRRILNKILTFAKNVDIRYTTFFVDKKHIHDTIELTAALSRQLSAFINENNDFFFSYDNVIVYYDNGQTELTRILAGSMAALLPQADFRKVIPADYRLFQVADLICTMELINYKRENHLLSKSEEGFFGSVRDLQKNYYNPLAKKHYKSGQWWKP